MKRLFKHLVLGVSLAAASTACIQAAERPRVEQTGDDSLWLGPDGLPGTADDLPSEPDPSVEPDPTVEPEPTEPEPTEPSEPDPATDPTVEPNPVVEPEPDPIVEPDPTEPDPVVEPEPDRPKVVLLLPGTSIAGDNFATMYDRLVDDDYTPIIYEPEDLFTGSLAQGAEDVGALVRSLKAEYDVATIDIVGQCDGGVVARYYLTLLGGAPDVGHFVTFVAPHHGSNLSGVGAWITGWQALEDVRPNSAFMQALNSVPLPAGLDMTSIYSCNDDLMVPYTTSVVAGATNVEFCDRYVQHLGAFDDAVVYDRIRMSLDGVADAPTYY